MQAVAATATTIGIKGTRFIVYLVVAWIVSENPT